MGKTRSRSPGNSRWNHLERFVGTKVPNLPPASADLMRAVVASIEYKDPVLMRAALAGIVDRCVTLTAEIIDIRVGIAEDIERELGELLSEFAGEVFVPSATTDRIAEDIEGQMIPILSDLRSVRDNMVRPLESAGVEVPNAGRLTNSIDRVEALKDRILGGWAKSTGPFPPADRDMIAASREQVARGESHDINDVIRRLEGEPE